MNFYILRGDGKCPLPPPSSKSKPDKTRQRICFIITGSGKRPVNWETFVSCIRYCELHILADTISESELYQEGDSTIKSELLYCYAQNKLCYITGLREFKSKLNSVQ